MMGAGRGGYWMNDGTELSNAGGSFASFASFLFHLQVPCIILMLEFA